MSDPANLTLLSIVRALNWIEFPPVCLLGFVSIWNAWMIGMSAILHVNLKAILLVQSALMLIYSGARFVNLIWRFIHDGQNIPAVWFTNIVMVAVTQANLMGHVMIVERILATLFVRKYEQWRGPWFTLGWMSLMIFLGLMSILIPSMGVSREFGFTVIFTHVVLVFSILELIAFAALNFYNQKRYEHFNNIRADLTHNYQLTERYQLHQNIYSGQQLAPSFLFHLVNILCSNAVVTLNVYLAMPNPKYDFYLSTIYVVHVFTKLAIEITVITFHPIMRRRMHGILTHFVKMFTGKKTSNVQQSATIFRMNNIVNGDGTYQLGMAHLAAENRINSKGPIHGKLQQNDQARYFKILEHFWQ